MFNSLLMNSDALETGIFPAHLPQDGSQHAPARAQAVGETNLFASELSELASPFTCSTCGTRFPLRKTLNHHQQTVHRQSSFVCAHCKKGFKRNDVKDRHEAEQHSGEDGTVECVRCRKRVRERALNGHLESRKYQQIRQHGVASIATTRTHGIEDQLRILKSLDVISVCHPLRLCANLIAKTGPSAARDFSMMERWKRWLKLKSPGRECLRLYDLSIRTMRTWIGSSNIDHALICAVVAFALAEARVIGDKNLIIHARAMKRMTVDRHDQTICFKALEYALNACGISVFGSVHRPE